MSRNNLPRYSIGLTLNERQLERLDEMIEKYNETSIAAGTQATAPMMPMTTREQCVFAGLVALEAILYNFTDPSVTSVFESR